MAHIELVRDVPLTAAEAWRRLTDWRGHAAGAPLTHIRTSGRPPGPGDRFVARTGVGPLGVDDPMEVVEWAPPAPERAGHCRIEKRGRLVLGHAVLRVLPLPGGGARVRWEEEIRLRGMPAALDPLLARAARLLFTRVQDRLLR